MNIVDLKMIFILKMANQLRHVKRSAAWKLSISIYFLVEHFSYHIFLSTHKRVLNKIMR